MITPSLNIGLPTANASPSAAKEVVPPPAVPAAAAPAPSAPAMPSATVTLSPQALSALAASHAPSSAGASAGTPTPPAPAAHDGSVYESLKNGLSTAVADVGDAIAGGAHAVVDGVETAVSTANTVAKGLLELPFAAVAKACDAAGALIDEL